MCRSAGRRDSDCRVRPDRRGNYDQREDQLAADDTVKAYQVDVDTRNGVVRLSGNVENTAAKEQAIQIARQTDGVRDVIDQIRVG